MARDNDQLICWDDRLTGRVEQDVMTFRHRLADLELFSDPGLASLLDRHPREALGVNSMGADPARQNEWREGEAADFSGAELLEMVARGRLWLNVRRAGVLHPEIAQLVDRLYDELQAKNPGFRAFNRSANLLISSPTALVYYHMDTPLNILWHIRGRKRVWVYPREERFISQKTLEEVIIGNHSEEIHYDPAFDDAAQVFDLSPGEVITWPQHTPHRVTNLDGLNVSLSTEHLTRSAQQRNNVYMANHYFRRILPVGFNRNQGGGPVAAAKEAAIRVARRMPWFDEEATKGYVFKKTFVVDPDAPQCLRLLDRASLA